MGYFDFRVRATVKGESREHARLILERFLDSQHDLPTGILSDSFIEDDVKGEGE